MKLFNFQLTYAVTHPGRTFELGSVNGWDLLIFAYSEATITTEALRDGYRSIVKANLGLKSSNLIEAHMKPARDIVALIKADGNLTDVEVLEHFILPPVREDNIHLISSMCGVKEKSALKSYSDSDLGEAVELLLSAPERGVKGARRVIGDTLLLKGDINIATALGHVDSRTFPLRRVLSDWGSPFELTTDYTQASEEVRSLGNALISFSKMLSKSGLLKEKKRGTGDLDSHTFTPVSDRTLIELVKNHPRHVEKLAEIVIDLGIRESYRPSLPVIEKRMRSHWSFQPAHHQTFGSRDNVHWVPARDKATMSR